MTVASVLVLALLSNVWALWPQLVNLDAIRFLAVSRELSANEDVQLYKESVVVIRTDSSKGTGFYFSADGYIMTNYHVVGEEASAAAVFQDGSRYRAEVVETIPDIDIAVLKIDAEPAAHPTLTFTAEWEPDNDVYVIGNPLFFNYIANKGTVLGLTTASSKSLPVMMIDAPVYKGNSGSPVINEAGEVVGVVFATSSVEHDGSRTKVGLAVPAEYVAEVVGAITD
ncbi:serine protease Do [Evansella caseinilytica]|uniref:Serine protease Do n=1 Tax=Evansella caseinilytica TaxID=1503961 RepID=A0A1H3SVN2_9BACI|nr:trypsin-like peptidase domain-containing protein [Evansella caseinilytica]SDZ41179.1 serine protease Do [Evansella caseinilytica]